MIELDRRGFVKGAGSLMASIGIDVTVFPQANMVATIAFATTSGNVPAAGRNNTLTYSEAGGMNQTVLALDNFVDPRGVFTQLRKRVTRSDMPGFRVEFVRMIDGSWASVEFWLGDSVTSPYDIASADIPAQSVYSISVTGDYSTSAPISTPNHWWGSRWRVSGSKANGLRTGRNDWPYAATAYATLVSDGVMPAFDPTNSNEETVVLGITPYTPMGASSQPRDQMEGGSPPGVFSEQAATYIMSLAPGASGTGQSLAAQRQVDCWNWAEACATWPVAVLDVTSPGLGIWDPLLRNSASVTQHVGLSETRLGITITGAPNTRYYVQGTYPNTAACTFSDPGGGSTWWAGVANDGGASIPDATTDSSGHASWLLMPGGPGAVSHYPYAGPVWTPSGDSVWVPSQPTFSWGGPSTFNLSTDWVIESTHMPEPNYLCYILWRDPWDLMALQAAAYYTAAYSPGGLGNGGMIIAQQYANDYRTAVMAWAATRDTEPAWIGQRSSLLTWMTSLQNQFINHGITTPVNPGFATVFRSLAAFSTGAQNSDATYCDGTSFATIGTYMDMLAEALFAQAAALNLMVRPSDTNAATIVAWHAQFVDGRYNGTSGWPQTVPNDFVMKMLPAPSGPGYASWGDAWTANAPKFLSDYRQTFGDGVCNHTSLVSVPGVMVGTTNTTWVWIGEDTAALLLTAQAGVTTFNTARNYAQTSLKSQNGGTLNRLAFKAV